MAKQNRNLKSVMGYEIQKPKLTMGAFIRFTQYIFLPVLAVGLLLDIALFFIIKYGFDSCYGLFCLLENGAN